MSLRWILLTKGREGKCLDASTWLAGRECKMCSSIFMKSRIAVEEDLLFLILAGSGYEPTLKPRKRAGKRAKLVANSRSPLFARKKGERNFSCLRMLFPRERISNRAATLPRLQLKILMPNAVATFNFSPIFDVRAQRGKIPRVSPPFTRIMRYCAYRTLGEIRGILAETANRRK